MMTIEQKLEALKADIRKQIPRLMELTEGCYIQHFQDEYSKKIYCLNDEGDICQFGYVNNTSMANNYTKDINKHYQIIGHEPMLNDVLEWFKLLGKDYSIDCFGNLIEFIGDKVIKVKTLVNLSTPYLKDQSLELINFLYNLSKEYEKYK